MTAPLAVFTRTLAFKHCQISEPKALINHISIFRVFQKGHVTTPKAMQSRVTIVCLASRDTLYRAA